MLAIPDNLTRADVAFGNISHMPRYSAVPDEFKSHNNAFARAVSYWFFKGVKAVPNGVDIDGQVFTAKPSVDCHKALAAIRSVLCSFEPKHEHKEAACAYMLSEWFDHA